MADFATAFRATMQHEGGYANHPADAGGETWRGISRVANPGWPGWVRVDAAKLEVSAVADLNRVLSADPVLARLERELYVVRYWHPIQGDQLPAFLAGPLFDASVNLGPKRASAWLQKVLNVFSREGKLYEYLLEDGIIGGKSHAALRILLSSERDPALVLTAFLCLRGQHHVSRAGSLPSQQVFVRGWLSRIQLSSSPTTSPPHKEIPMHGDRGLGVKSTREVAAGVGIGGGLATLLTWYAGSQGVPIPPEAAVAAASVITGLFAYILPIKR